MRDSVTGVQYFYIKTEVLKYDIHSPTGAGGHQNGGGRGRVFPIILAWQEPQRYKNEILVIEGLVIPQMKALTE